MTIKMTQQEQEEQWIFDSFIKAYRDADISAYFKTEAPDYIIKLKDLKVGLELTEIFQDSDEKFSELQRNSSDWKTFTEGFITKLQPHIDFKFMVGIDFSRFHSIKKSEKHSVLSKLVESCVPKLKGLQNREHLDLDYYDSVPEQIDSVHFSRYDALPESMNYQPEGGTVRELTSAVLQTVIDKKDKKLRTYSPCDEYWLLIREGNYYAGSFSDEIAEPLVITSAYDKVFLFRTRKNEIISLK
ncbi:hypothetical protein ACTJIJ_08085 [Niabella sp. 22666]|uniref:hypothetical protein n=1 Tax=Niabella sp. 22666 TaxID=3453954 RepID=UPI003F87D396